MGSTKVSSLFSGNASKLAGFPFNTKSATTVTTSGSTTPASTSLALTSNQSGGNLVTSRISSHSTGVTAKRAVRIVRVNPSITSTSGTLAGAGKIVISPAARSGLTKPTLSTASPTVLVRDKFQSKPEDHGSTTRIDVIQELEKAKQEAEDYKLKFEKLKAQMEAIEKVKTNKSNTGDAIIEKKNQV